MLFIDGRQLGTLIPGSRKQKQLSTEDVERVARIYRQFKRAAAPEEVGGFCRVVTTDAIRTSGYALSCGRYVGTDDAIDDGMSIGQRLPQLVAEVRSFLRESTEIQQRIERALLTIESAE